MEALIIGIATAFNFLIIKTKVEKKRYEDAAFDAFTLFALTVMFGGTLGGMIIATIGSFITSLWLLKYPPKFLRSFDTSSFINEFKERIPK